ncbi:MAG: YfhO family protein [Planctomycetes bacterium]|nr:YfhO family protein [Planctomycetota bacterium]
MAGVAGAPGAPGATDSRPGAPRRATGWIAGAAALAALGLLLVAFFWTPISKYATHSYIAADLTQDSAWTRVDQAGAPKNRLLSDPVTEMVPWLLYNREELSAGRLPLWNDKNACGEPHLANFQSAVFSPFSVPFYVLSLKAALLVSAVMKLGFLALFTFLFLRRLELGALASAVGAAAFTFSGHNVLLLPYPHAAAVVVLPAGLLFAEIALRRGESGGKPLPALAALAATFGLGLFCGQPEPYYFSVLFVALWCGARLVGIAWRQWLDRGTAVPALWLAGRLVVAALAGAALGAPQVLPFLEYLENSTILVWRSADQTPLNPITWLLYVFPDLMGNPSRLYNLSYAVPPPNYESANTCYLGAFALLAAGSSLLFLRRIPAARFFLAVAVVWFLYAYDILGMARLAAWIPTLGLAPINRSQPVGLFALSACAAIAVHGAALSARDPACRSRWKWSLATLLVGGLSMWYVALRAWRFFAMLRKSGYAKGLPAGADAYVPEHFQLILWSFALGLAALTALWFARRAWQRVLLQTLILLAVFLPSGWSLRDYNPTVEDRLVYPRTAAVERLKALAGDDPVVILGPETIPPHTNSVYGLRSLSSYDAMWVRKYDELYRESFGLGGGNWRLALQTQTRWIRRFGARTLASPGPWIKVDSLCDSVLLSPTDLYQTPALLPGVECVQTFLGQRERLQGVALMFGVPGGAVHCTVTAKLTDLLTGLVVAEQSWRTEEWRNDRHGRHEVLFHFPPMVDARHRPLELRLSSPDAAPGNAVTLWAREDYWYWNQYVLLEQPLHEVIWSLEPSLRRPGRRTTGALTVAGKALEGGLLLDQAYDLESWRALESVAGFTVGELVDPLPRYTTVSRALAARSVGDDFRLTHQANLDPRRIVVLSYPEGPVHDLELGRADRPEPEVRVLRDVSDRAELEVTREAPGYVVMRRTYFPGWEVRVNGEPARLLRADYAFSAVEVGAGTSRIELVYHPRSFLRGLWIAALVPLAAALACWLTRRRGAATLRTG